MTLSELRAGLLRALLVLAGLWTGPAAALTVTDILGREVELDGPAERVILGEGRFLAVLGVLGIEDPLARVAGMMNEFRRFDPAGFERYREAFPAIEEVPTFGQTSEQSVSVEQAILLGPDVAIFGIQGHGPGAHSRHIIDRLAAAGIPTVFIDFRQDPLGNTARSVEIVGQVLGREAAARAFAAMHRAGVAAVTDPLRERPPASCPSVLLDLRVDARQGCCLSVAEGLFADLVAAAGGCNIAEGLLPGAVGELSLEHVISSAPEVYIGTAIGAPGSAGAGRIVLGSGVEPGTARGSLARALDRPGLAGLPAVTGARAHALWHHFYNSPLNVYALQRIAKWLHPERYAHLDPEATLQALLARFHPVDLTGTYATSLR
jgi:iron complex transport system substrate-binding protein